MNRREALRSIAMSSAGATAVPAWVVRLSELARSRGAGLVTGQASAAPAVFTPAQYDAVVQLAELIIPRTDTAGATDARVAEFIDTVLNDAAQSERQEFLRGLAWIDARARERYGVDFNAAQDQQQEALLTAIAGSGNDDPADAVGRAFFQAMKQLTVTGYYTSEAGMREELGDSGSLAFADDPGCQHPEHKS